MQSWLLKEKGTKIDASLIFQRIILNHVFDHLCDESTSIAAINSLTYDLLLGIMTNMQMSLRMKTRNSRFGRHSQWERENDNERLVKSVELYQSANFQADVQ